MLQNWPANLAFPYLHNAPYASLQPSFPGRAQAGLATLCCFPLCAKGFDLILTGKFQLATQTGDIRRIPTPLRLREEREGGGRISHTLALSCKRPRQEAAHHDLDTKTYVAWRAGDRGS